MCAVKVCMLTSGHSALDDRIFYKESMSLQRAGYEVTLIAPLDNEGFLFDMGRNKIAVGETTMQDIRIIGFRQKLPRFKKVQAMLQLLRLASVGKLSLGDDLYKDLIDKAVSLNADVYHCHEIWSLHAGIQIKNRLEKKGRKSKLIYDVHEYTPAVGPSSNIVTYLYTRTSRKAIIRFEKEALKYADYVITVSEAIKGYLLTQNRLIQTEVIYNCSFFPIYQELERSIEHKDKVTICHEGSLKFDRGLKQMIEVMKVLKENYGDRVELLIIGDVYTKEREYLEEKLEEYELHDTIRRTGWLPYEKVGEAISQADIGIIFFEPTENIMLGGGLSNKVFNYMRCGLSIVSVDLPENSCIIRETECGLVVKDRSASSLAGALSILIDDEGKRRQMGENARNAAYNQYSWEQMEKRLLRVYAELLP